MLGPQSLARDDATLNRYARASAGETVRPDAVAFPESRQAVIDLVAAANRMGLALHPISRGRNWGYSDARPPTAGQIVVDLSRLTAIELNVELGYAILEPGVTQGQLYEHLQTHAPHLCMDATGAGPDASIVGNALDRGFGHTRYGDHVQTTCGMEVVLADGRVIRTGFGAFANAKAEWAYPYGVGPCLDGLFSQSNLGIVTRLGVWLMPRPEATCAFFVWGERDDDLGALVDAITPLRRAGLLTSAIHIANDLRALSGMMRRPTDGVDANAALPDDVRRRLRDQRGLKAWNAFGMITGTRGSVRAVRKHVRRELRAFRPTFVSPRRLAIGRRVADLGGRSAWAQRLSDKLDGVGEVYRLLCGEPVGSMLSGVAWRLPHDRALDPSDDPLAWGAGLRWCSPALPMTGEHASEVYEIVAPIYRSHGFDPLTTFTMINERAMICVTNLAYDAHDTAQSERAYACYRALHESLTSAGYYPYRADPVHTQSLLAGAGAYGELIEQLKDAIDPGGVISPR